MKHKEMEDWLTIACPIGTWDVNVLGIFNSKYNITENGRVALDPKNARAAVEKLRDHIKVRSQVRRMRYIVPGFFRKWFGKYQYIDSKTLIMYKYEFMLLVKIKQQLGLKTAWPIRSA